MLQKLTFFFFDREENILGKEEILVTSIFTTVPIMFSKAFFLRVFKGRDCVVKGFIKSIQDIKTMVAQELGFCHYRKGRKIEGKKENDDYQHLFSFPAIFSEALSKTWDYLVHWKKVLLTHCQTKIFRLFQTERVCRRQFQI